MSGESTGLLLMANDDVDQERLDAALERLRGSRRVEVVRTTGSDECGPCIDRRAGRTLVLAGGDGTLSTTIHELRMRQALDDTVVGLLPMGTGNDFARTLGLPFDPTAAADVILAGRTLKLDLMVSDGDATVVNAVHAGIGADAAGASQRFKDALGPAAYPVGAAMVGASGDVSPLRVTIDGEVVFDGDALMVGIGNGPTIGGGAPLTPGARPDDGLLDVVVVEADTIPQKIGFARDLRAGEHVDREDVRRFQGRTVEIDGAPVRYNADGELSEPRPRASYTLWPAAWTILAS
jgi:YegS/Rv2252/BmrU family lipid kinase